MYSFDLFKIYSVEVMDLKNNIEVAEIYVIISKKIQMTASHPYHRCLSLSVFVAVYVVVVEGVAVVVDFVVTTKCKDV